MATIAGYFDESFEGGLFSFAGYVGTVDTWDNMFTPSWKAMVDGAPHKLREFKASDCRQCAGGISAGEFDCSLWTPDECRALTIQAVDLIADRSRVPNICGVGTCLAFPPIPSEHYDKFLRTGYLLGLGNVVGLTIHMMQRYFPREKSVQFVCDTREIHRGVAMAMFDKMTPDYEKEFGIEIERPLLFKESHKLAPLQAADLLAYETRKEVDNCNLAKPARKVSMALRRIASSCPHAATLLPSQQVRSQFKRTSKGLEPEELDPIMLYDTTEHFPRVG